MILFLFLLLILAIVAWNYQPKKKRSSKFPPGPTQYPIIGSMIRFGRNPFKCLDHWKTKYGEIVGLKLGSRKAVVLNGYNLIKEALSSMDFNDRPKFLQWVWFVGGLNHGLLTTTGDDWAYLRNFAMKSLKDVGFFGSAVESQLQRDIDHWISSLSSEVPQSNGKVISMENHLHNPACFSMWNLITGEEMTDYGDNVVEEFMQKVAELKKRFFLPISNPIWFLPELAEMFPEVSGIRELKIAVEDFHNLMDKHINYKFGEHADFTHKPRSLVEAFLREIYKAREDSTLYFYGEKGFNHMKALLRVLFFESAVVINNALEHAVLQLSLNQEAQTKLYEEITNVVGEHRLPCISDIPRMPYTTAVIQEVFRISNISPFSNFQMTLNDVNNFHGYNITKGTVVIANLYGINSDRKLWENPERFLPERFLADPSKLPQFIPFSTGLRTCPGQHFTKHFMFLFITMTFQKFKFQWDTNLPLPTKEDIMNVEGISMFKFCMKFKPFVSKRRES